MIYAAPITSHGDLAQRLAELRQLGREGCPQAAEIDETIRAYHKYNEEKTDESLCRDVQRLPR